MPQQSTVLVVDDEDGVLELMRDFLEAEGFAVLGASDADQAGSIMDREVVDCVLLDIMMPGISGFDFCRQIRQQSDVPLLFLSARDGDIDKIRGLHLGGDDYIVKSATPFEVVARIRAVLRRYHPAPPAIAHEDPGVLDFGRLVVDVRAGEIRIDGRPVPTPAREFELLRLLAEHPRQVFSRDHLFERGWGAFGDKSTVTTHIRRLREKIEEDPADPRYIVTVRGLGYRFEGKRR